MKGKTKLEIFEEFISALRAYGNNPEKLYLLLKEKNIITDNFEDRYLYAITKSEWNHSEINQVDITNTYSIIFSQCADGLPYRTEFSFDGEWKIRSYTSLCIGCFGEYTYCGVCGGSGWGVL